MWHERYAWHDARGLMDSAPPEALFEPEPSLESGVTKRRFRNLVDASGLWRASSRSTRARRATTCSRGSTTRPTSRTIRARSAADGGDAGHWTPFGRGTYDVAALAAGGCIAAADAVARRPRPQRLRARPPARPPRGAGRRLRLLRLLERRADRAAPPARARPRAGRDRRLGRAPRQRDAGDVLDGPDRARDLAAPGRPVPGRLGAPGGDRGRGGRGGDDQRPAAGGVGARRVPRRVRPRRAPGARPLRARVRARRLGARREHVRPARPDEPHERVLRRADRPPPRRRGRPVRRAPRALPRGRLLERLRAVLRPGDRRAARGRRDRRRRSVARRRPHGRRAARCARTNPRPWTPPRR